MGIRTVLLVPILFVGALVVAQSNRERTSPSVLPVQERVIRTAQQDAFKTSSVLPDCYTYAVERGDPEAGPSANAQVLFVSGTFQLHMKGQQVQILSQGSYAYVPADHQH